MRWTVKAAKGFGAVGRRGCRRLMLAVAVSMTLPLNPLPAHADDATAYTFWVASFVPAAGNNLKWKDSTGFATYGNSATAGADSWSSATTHITLTKVTAGANIEVHLDATTVDPSHCGYTNPSTYDANGHWNATVHWFYISQSLSGSTSTQRKQCAVHEFGHALGLDHTDRALCSQVQIMDAYRYRNPSTGAWTNNDMYSCNPQYQDPRAGDVAGVNLLY